MVLLPDTTGRRHESRCRRTGVFDGGAGGFESGDRDAERGAGDVVEAGLVEEVDGIGVAAQSVSRGIGDSSHVY